MVYECIKNDLQHIWHPCSIMKDFERVPPLVVHKAEGSYLYTDKGPLIDATASWWCKSLGHGHPAIKQAIHEQLLQFEHVIAANTTHPKLSRLGELLAQLSNNQHVYFASDGASAVEIALKMALHANKIKGAQGRKFLALQNGYHGETSASLSVSDLSLYKKPYQELTIPCQMIGPLPYVANKHAKLWLNAESSWHAIEAQLNTQKEDYCALILEPLVQGSAGMLCYSADFLQKLVQWAQKNKIWVIADEIMTGLLRTGTWFAFQQAQIQPDLICISKGLTSGSIPMSCVLASHELYTLFYEGANPERAFLHSHTFSGNALAVSAALATLTTMMNEGYSHKTQQLSQKMHDYFQEICKLSGRLENFRHLGAIVAADLVPHPHRKNLGFDFYAQALEYGALIRPINRTVYWLPPLNTGENTLVNLAEITLKSIDALYK